MAFALRNQNDDALDTPPVSDINVTPLVDVMLVLLIVFMVAAPLMTAGIPVDLPKATAKPLVDQKQPISVSIDADGKYFVDKREVAADELILVLDESADGKERRIHVRGDKNIAYGKVIEVMSLINSAGYTKVALVSDPAARPPGL
ncbi:MAG TPA: protein TolR [Methylocella sp.]|nr:protein TolR [Methylocella sp.]